MSSAAPPLHLRPAMTSASRQRWDELLDSIAGLLPAGPAWVLIDGHGDQPAVLAGRLASTLNIAGRPYCRLRGAEAGKPSPAAERPCIPAAAIRLADGARWRQARHWDVVIWLRTPPGPGGPPDADGEAAADIVIDLHDPGWPVIRRVAARWPAADPGTPPRPARSSPAAPPPGTPGSAATCPPTSPPSPRPACPPAA